MKKKKNSGQAKGFYKENGRIKPINEKKGINEDNFSTKPIEDKIAVTKKIGGSYPSSYYDTVKKMQDKAHKKLTELKLINGKKYDIESFHPTAFQKGVFTVRFHESGQPYLDKYSISTMVQAKNEKEAIQIARDELKLDIKGNEDIVQQLEQYGNLWYNLEPYLKEKIVRIQIPELTDEHVRSGLVYSDFNKLPLYDKIVLSKGMKELLPENDLSFIK